MSTKPTPTTVAQYLKGLPEDRRAIVDAIRETINANIDPKFAEGIQYAMIGLFVPHSVYPAGYHCDPAQPLPFASVASQKGHVGIYLFCLYMDEAEQTRFVKAWKATGKRLDMGKSCVRVKKLEDVPLEVVGEAIARMSCERFIEQYEKSRPAPAKKGGAKTGSTPKATKKTAKKTAGKAPAAKKADTKKTTVGKTAKKPAKKTGKATAKKPATRKAAPK